MARVNPSSNHLCRLPPMRLRRRASTLCRSTHPILPILVQHALTLPFSHVACWSHRSLAPNSCAVLAHVSRDRERPSVDLDAVSVTQVGQKPVVVIQTFEVRDADASVAGSQRVEPSVHLFAWRITAGSPPATYGCRSGQPPLGVRLAARHSTAVNLPSCATATATVPPFTLRDSHTIRRSISTAPLSYRTVELPYTSEWFSVPPHAPHGQTPKLGILHPSLMTAVMPRTAQQSLQSKVLA